MALAVFITTLLLHICSCQDGTPAHIYKLDSKTGSLQSEGYPMRYEDYSVSQYFIRPVLDVGSILKLVPEDFDLEGGYDNVEVRETGPHGRYIGQFTGDVMPILYGKSFWLRFTSDFSNAKKGFKFSWSVETSGVRLVNGSNGLEGRVELFHAAKWGTICDDSWEPAEAYVTCRMMGFNESNARQFTQGHFGRGVDPIWLDNTRCFKNHSSLDECRVDAWGAHNCNHGEDSGVRCTDAFLKTKRLQRRTTSFPKGCSQTFKNASGSVQSPQFPLYPNFAQCEYVLASPDATKLLKVNFTLFDLQDDKDFLEIREDGPTGVILGRYTGSHLPPVIYAQSLWMFFMSDDAIGRRGFLMTYETVSEGTRLRNGTVYSEGRVEVYTRGTWGTICDDSWGKEEATVVCEMLGYRTDGDQANVTAVAGGVFGPGLGDIKYDDMSCTGREDNLHQCSRSDTHNCNHQEDAGVMCNAVTSKSRGVPPINNGSTETMVDAVEMSCDSQMMTVKVNVTSVGSMYPGLASGDMYLSLDMDTCVGQMQDDVIVFENDITDCGMTASETLDSVIYRNRVVGHNNGSSGGSGAVLRSQGGFVVPVECHLAKSVQLSSQLAVYWKRKTDNTVRGYGNFTAEMSFYKDPGFSQEMVDFPLYVELNQELYVETRILTKDPTLSLVLHDCDATSGPNATDSYPLITNRCAKDPTTQIVPSPTNTSSRFLFKTFKFLEQKKQVFIKCSMLVCNVTDTSARCRSDCRSSGRTRRSAPSNSKPFVDVIKGPIILKSAPTTAASRDIHISGTIAGCSVAVLVVLVIVLAVVAARRRKKVQTWYVNRVFDEFDHNDKVMMMPMGDTS